LFQKQVENGRISGEELIMSRWIAFLLAIALGAAAGMYYGWVLSPVKYVDTAPDSLRIDYKTDYVLMVAEAYYAENDMGLAVRRLALLGDLPPAEIIANTIAFAEDNQYPQADLALMQTLAEALKTWNPSLEVPSP
jgi:hypothetical protein